MFNNKNYFFLILIFSVCVQAKGIYLEPDNFLEQVFASDPPKPEKLWITSELKPKINNIMGHDLDVIRLRYWKHENKTVWILEEIGRDKPITVGYVIKDNKIQRVNVLIFRESRGWEVKYPFFTDQYKDVSLQAENKLNKSINGISGATLSVNALNKMARLALFLNRYVKERTE